MTDYQYLRPMRPAGGSTCCFEKFGKLLRLSEETLVYPAHDYNGMTVSTIGEEKRFNPRLQVGSVAEYADLMNGLELSDPRLMDVAVPANLACGNRAGARPANHAIA